MQNQRTYDDQEQQRQIEFKQKTDQQEKIRQTEKQENQINQLIEQVGKSNFLTIGKN